MKVSFWGDLKFSFAGKKLKKISALNANTIQITVQMYSISS